MLELGTDQRFDRCCRPTPAPAPAPPAGRQTGQRDGARLRREHDRRPHRSDERLHLVTNRIGYRRQMHLQLRGDVIVYARDGRRVQRRLAVVGAHGLSNRRRASSAGWCGQSSGHKMHWHPCLQTRTPARRFWRRVCTVPPSTALLMAACRQLQRVVMSTGASRIRRHRRHQRHRRFGKRQVSRHAFDDPAQGRNHRGWGLLFITEAYPVDFCV